MGLLREHAIPILIYSLLTLMALYPVLGSLATSFPFFEYSPDGDAYLFLWILWNAGLNFPSTLFYSDMIFYPHGASMIASTPIPLLAALTLPIQNIFGLFAAFNFIIIASFILSGYFAFRLCRHLVKDYWPSILGGAAFALAPYHFAHILQLNLASTQWIPLFFLFFFKNQESPSTKNKLLLAGSFALNLYTCEMYALFILLFLSFYLLYSYVRSRGGLVNCTLDQKTFKIALFSSPAFLKEKITGNRIPIVVSIALCFPIIVLMAYGGLFVDYGVHPLYYTLFRIAFSADLSSYFLPNPYGFAFQGLTLPLYLPSGIFESSGGANIQETSVSLGYVVLAFSLFAAIRLKDERLKLLFFFGLFFALLSFGPLIKVLGLPLIPSFSELLFSLPIMGHFRVPSRLAVMVALSSSVLFAAGFSEACRRIPKYRYFLAIGVFLLLMLEFYPFGLAAKTPQVPPFIYTLKNYPNTTAILNLPYQSLNCSIQLNKTDHTYLFNLQNLYYIHYQTINGKKTMNGVLSRIPVSSAQEFNTGWMNQLGFFSITDPQYVRSSLIATNITHILLHKQLYSLCTNETSTAIFGTYANSSDVQAKLLPELGKLGFPVVYSDNHLEVYSVE